MILTICILSVVGYIVGGIITFFLISYISVSGEIDKKGQLIITEDLDVKEAAVSGLIWPVVLVLVVGSLPCRGLAWLSKHLRQRKIERIKRQHRLRTLVTTGDE